METEQAMQIASGFPLRKGDLVILNPGAAQQRGWGADEKWEVPAYKIATEEDNRRFYEKQAAKGYPIQSDGEWGLPPRRYLVYLKPDVPYIVTKARVKVSWASKGYAQVFDTASGYEVCVSRSYLKPI